MINNASRLALAVGIFASAVSAAGSASAQAWASAAGLVMGEEAAREKACLAGEPPDPKIVPKIAVSVDRKIASYFALTSQSKPAEIGKVFNMKAKGVSFRDAAGTISPLNIGAKLDEPTPILTQMTLIVAGDMTSARGIWTTKPTDGSPAMIYAADLSGSIPGWTNGNWKIMHMAVLPAEQAPAVPSAYCHFDPVQAF